MKGAGFTLIELLMVIAILALIIALLIPSLQNSRQHTKAVLCGSNIRQLVSGLFMYETDHQTFPYGYHFRPTPPPGGYPGYLQYDRIGWWWFNYITDYSRSDYDKDSIIWCPSRKVKNTKLKNNVLCGNYGVNQSICKSSSGRNSHAEFVGTPLRSSDIRRPGETLLVVDSGYSMINWWHVTDVPPIAFGSTIEDCAYVPGLEINKDKKLWPGQEQDAINGRHPNKTVNVGFADGHVSRTKADKLLVEKTGDTYKNRSPLWLPE